jgi:hypothetical protein
MFGVARARCTKLCLRFRFAAAKSSNGPRGAIDIRRDFADDKRAKRFQKQASNWNSSVGYNLAAVREKEREHD